MQYIYPEQFQYMLELKHALDAKGHCLLEVCTALLFSCFVCCSCQPTCYMKPGFRSRMATDAACWLGCRCPRAPARPSRCCRSSPPTSWPTPRSASWCTAHGQCRRWRRCSQVGRSSRRCRHHTLSWHGGHVQTSGDGVSSTRRRCTLSKVVQEHATADRHAPVTRTRCAP